MYRHRLLYADNKLYIRDKLIKKSDIEKVLKHFKAADNILKPIKNTRRKSLEEINFNFQYDCEPKEYEQYPSSVEDKVCEPSIGILDSGIYKSDEELISGLDYYDYSKRYSRLRSNGIFYSNINFIYSILMHTNSRGEFCIKCTLAGIPEEYKNYAILYMMTTRNRWFDSSFEYVDKKRRKQLRFDRISDMERWNRWVFIQDMYDDIIDGKLETCTYKEFIKEQI